MWTKQKKKNVYFILFSFFFTFVFIVCLEMCQEIVFFSFLFFFFCVFSNTFSIVMRWYEYYANSFWLDWQKLIFLWNFFFLFSYIFILSSSISTLYLSVMGRHRSGVWELEIYIRTFYLLLYGILPKGRKRLYSCRLYHFGTEKNLKDNLLGGVWDGWSMRRV